MAEDEATDETVGNEYGQRCANPDCNGWLVVFKTRLDRVAMFRRQFFWCWKCHWRADINHRVIHLDRVRKASRKMAKSNPAGGSRDS